MARLAGAESSLRFNHCVFKSLADLFDDDEMGPDQSPSVLLGGAQGQTPTPTFFACSFEPSSNAVHAIALDTAASGEIMMINSLLSKGVGAGISNAAPPALDSHGNYLLP